MRRLIAAITLLPAIAGAQTPAPPGSSNAPSARAELPALPVLEARRVAAGINIDGKLDDAAWALAAVARDFRQIDPDDGKPATEPTEVRILYDDDALYIGARMFDSEPGKIRSRLARRDEPLEAADLFQVFIDSYHDRLTGFVFRITPAGAIRDAAWLGDGDQDNSWDAVWESATTIDSLGWTAEIRIPFSQLRYNATSGPQAWGLNFDRIISRKGETDIFAWTPKSAARGPQRWATLEGLTNLPRAHHLELLPYATTRAEYLIVDPDNPFRDQSEMGYKAGLDLKYGLTSGLTLSGTVNPDFGQVEVDPARVNLSANELFFPERRPFFVEGAGIFGYGRIRTLNNWNFPTLFHSRRIGRAPQRQIASSYAFVDSPEEATIAGAAKVTGHIRGGTSVGILDALTMRETARFQGATGVRGREPVEPQTNYFVGRAKQDFRQGNTSFGLLTTAVNRNLSDVALAPLFRRDAYFTGLDFNQSWLQRKYVLDASYGQSAVFGTPAAIASTQRSSVHYYQRPDIQNQHYDPTRRSLYGSAWQLSAAKLSGAHILGNVTLQGVSPGFEVNDVGFHSSTSYKALSTALAVKSDIPGKIFRNWLTGPFSGHTWNYDGDRTTVYYGMHLDGRFRNFWRFNWNEFLYPETLDDRLTRGGPLAAKPRARSREIFVGSDPRRIWGIEAYYERNRNDAGGWENKYFLGFTIRPSSALRISIGPQYTNALYQAQFITSSGDTSAHDTYGRRYVFGALRYHEAALETRVDWTFTPELSLQMFVQPLVADGRFSDFKSLRAPRIFEFDHFTTANGKLSKDADGYVLRPSAGNSIAIGNPDFSSRNLVGNAVVRWGYRPGSALFFVWQQRRAGEALTDSFDFTHDLQNIFRERPENVFAVKATFWWAR